MNQTLWPRWSQVLNGCTVTVELFAPLLLLHAHPLLDEGLGLGTDFDLQHSIQHFDVLK